MARSNSLTGWIEGEPPASDDGALAIVQLRDGVTIDGEDHYGQPVVVARWSSKLQTTAGIHRVEYSDVVRYIDIAA
jgi:hypothetical protein